MVKPLPNWIVTEGQPSFYETEGQSAIQMVAKLYGKVQELIEEINKQDLEIEDAIKYMKDNLTETLTELVIELIENGDIFVSFKADYDSENETLDLGIDAIPSQALLERLSTLATPEGAE